jgi:hypothetical protein
VIFSHIDFLPFAHPYLPFAAKPGKGSVGTSRKSFFVCPNRERKLASLTPARRESVWNYEKAFDDVGIE